MVNNKFSLTARIALFSAIVISSLFAFSVPASAWAREGHETVAKLAELNLNKSTKRTVEKYLGGHSIVYYAKWCDLIRKTPEYIQTDKWHTDYVDESLNYAPSSKGDAVFAIKSAIETLRDWKHQPDSVVATNIKFLIHFVGDMHCPSHMYFEGIDRSFSVRLEDSGHTWTSFGQHAVWDYALIQANRYYSATEWAEELDKLMTKEQKKELAKGTPEEWLHESATRAVGQFERMKPGEKLGNDFVMWGMDLIETQISYAGVRLAAILNEIF